MAVKALLVDQYSGLSPYVLQQRPVKFETLCAEILAEAEVKRSSGRPMWREPQVVEVEESYVPPMCTVLIRADHNGNATVWKERVDSSD